MRRFFWAAGVACCAAACGHNSPAADSPGSSGGSANAGAPPDDSGTSGTRTNGGAPPTKVSDCNSLPEPGKFENIIPAEVKAGLGQMQPGASQAKGGPFAMAVDPVNLGTIYSGTVFQGVWKSTDCGANWTKLTGNNSDDVNRGMNWTLGLDPQDPNVLYTNSGYGSNGLFKSTDAGANWVDVWSAKSQPELSKAFQYNFANVVAIDPTDHLHVLLTFHEPCLPPHASTCIVETFDAGSTWKIIDGQKDWNGNEGQVIFFMDDSKTWLWGSQTNGFYRSADSGKSWEQIPGMATSHLQGSQLARTADGTYYMAANDGIWTSPDGKVDTWKVIPDTGPVVGGLITTGTELYASTCYFYGICDQPRYLHSPESDGKKWTAMPNVPKMAQGGNLAYDKAHKLLYSSNLDSLYRVVLE